MKQMLVFALALVVSASSALIRTDNPKLDPPDNEINCILDYDYE